MPVPPAISFQPQAYCFPAESTSTAIVKDLSSPLTRREVSCVSAPWISMVGATLPVAVSGNSRISQEDPATHSSCGAPKKMSGWAAGRGTKVLSVAGLGTRLVRSCMEPENVLVPSWLSERPVGRKVKDLAFLNNGQTSLFHVHSGHQPTRFVVRNEVHLRL